MAVSRGAWLAAASALTYGSLGVFAKLAFEAGWNIPSLLAARFLFAGLTVLPFALRGGGSWRGAGAAFAIGALGYAGTTAFYFPSVALLPAAVASFLLFLSPLLIALLSWIFLRERLGTRGWLALGLALVGLVLLASGAFDGRLSPLGTILGVGSAVVYSVTVLASRGVAQRMRWARLSLGVCAGAMTSYLAFSLATRQLHAPATPSAWLWAACLGILATGIPLALWFAALARVRASTVGVIGTLEPVSTLVLAAIFLAEIPDALGIVGGLLIAGAAAIVAVQAPAAPHE